VNPLRRKNMNPARHEMHIVRNEKLDQSETFGDTLQVGFVDRIAATRSMLPEIIGNSGYACNLLMVVVFHAGSLGSKEGSTAWRALSPINWPKSLPFGFGHLRYRTDRETVFSRVKESLAVFRTVSNGSAASC